MKCQSLAQNLLKKFVTYCSGKLIQYFLTSLHFDRYKKALHCALTNVLRSVITTKLTASKVQVTLNFDVIKNRSKTRIQ